MVLDISVDEESSRTLRRALPLVMMVDMESIVGEIAMFYGKGLMTMTISLVQVLFIVVWRLLYSIISHSINTINSHP